MKDLVLGYSKHSFIKKDRDDGSREIVSHLRDIKAKPEVLKVCGVNLDACVMSTVEGLQKNSNYKVRVLLDACAGTGGEWEPFYIKKMKELKNTEVVH